MSDKKKKIESEVSENAAEITEKIEAEATETAAEAVENAEAQVSDASEIAAEAVDKAEDAPKKKKKKASAPLTAEEKAAKKLQKKFDRVDKKFSWRTVLKIVIPLVIIIILVFVLVKAAFGNSKNIKFDTSSFLKSDASPVDKSKGINGQLLSDAGMTIFADNGKLRLGYSPRDDLFIIQDLSTGRVLFPGMGNEEMMRAQCSETAQAKDPRLYRPELTEGFCQMLEAMLVKDRDYRVAAWPDVFEMCRLVEKGVSFKPRATPGVSSLKLDAGR